MAVGIAFQVATMLVIVRYQGQILRWLMMRQMKRVTAAPAMKPSDRLGGSRTPGTGDDANLTP